MLKSSLKGILLIPVTYLHARANVNTIKRKTIKHSNQQNVRYLVKNYQVKKAHIQEYKTHNEEKIIIINGHKIK